jgi:hypothetical protein
VSQLTLNFEPGLLQRFPRWEDTFITAVYGSRKGLNDVAADCDQSPSELSKRLSHVDGGEPRPLRSADILNILRSTNDFTPVYWLIEQFLKDPQAKQQEALAAIPGLVERLNAVLEQAAPAKQRAR